MDVVTVIQAIGMFLVVLGHSFPPDTIILMPSNVKFINTVIYSFHMPLFAFISGYLFRKYYHNKTYAEFMAGKITGLLIPYCFFILVTTLVKSVVSRYAVNPISFDLALLFRYFLYPEQAPIVVYWFLAILFTIFMLAPLLNKVLTLPKAYGIILTVLLFFSHAIAPLRDFHIFALNRLSDLLTFFWLGCIWMLYDQTLTSNVFNSFMGNVSKWLAFFASLCLLIALNILENGIYNLPFFRAAVGILTVWLAGGLYVENKLSFLKPMYRKTYFMYLTHGIVVVFSAAFLRKIGADWNIFLPTVFIVSYIVPLVVYQVIFRCDFQKLKLVRVLFGI